MIARAQLEQASRDVVGYLDYKFGKGAVGLTVFVFDFGDKGNVAYVSTAQRADMIAAVEEWLSRVKVGLDTDPLGPRAEG